VAARWARFFFDTGTIGHVAGRLFAGPSTIVDPFA